MLLSFVKVNIEAIIKWLKKVWFEAKLRARLDIIEFENQIEAEQERKQQAEPIYREYAPDPEKQTGESLKLGGEMRLSAPWVVEDSSEEHKGY